MDAENTPVFQRSLADGGGEIAKIFKNTVEKELMSKFMYKEKQIIMVLQSLLTVSGLRLGEYIQASLCLHKL